jgi:elongator complex protein 3
LQDAPLCRQWKQGDYRPLKDEELVDLLVEIKKIIPPYVRINRLGRDIPIGNVVAGYQYSHVRQLAQKKLKKQGFSCQCIRCREIKSKESRINPLAGGQELRIIKYFASAGEEYFLQIVNENNRLYTMLRLRLPGSETKPIFSGLKNAALIRELHTYGKSLDIGEQKNEVSQHHGLGKELMEKAEKIAQKEGFGKIAVIAGVGVRNYYRRLGYHLDQTYMVKSLY